MRKPIIERAFELAESGSCRHLTDLKEALRREGYDQIAAHLDGSAIRRALALRLPSGAPTSESADRRDD